MTNIKLFQESAFTLIELMVTIVIIGILAAIAIPSYKQYIVDSKIAEAYGIMDAIGKAQISFFSEYNEFQDVLPQPLGFDKPMIFSGGETWENIGNPVPVGANLFFTYRSRAGKVNSTGTELVTSTVNGTWNFTNVSNNTVLAGRYYNPPTPCNSAIATPATVGATVEPEYAWTLISAVGDLNNNMDSSCTAIGRLLEASSATEGKPAFRSSYLILNKGD